jgi:hypothetical protein
VRSSHRWWWFSARRRTVCGIFAAETLKTEDKAAGCVEPIVAVIVGVAAFLQRWTPQSIGGGGLLGWGICWLPAAFIGIIAAASWALLALIVPLLWRNGVCRILADLACAGVITNQLNRVRCRYAEDRTQRYCSPVAYSGPRAPLLQGEQLRWSVRTLTRWNAVGRGLERTTH